MKKYVKSSIGETSNVPKLPDYDNIEDVLVRLGFKGYQILGEVGPVSGMIYLAIKDDDVIEYNNWGYPFSIYKGMAKDVDKYIRVMTEYEDFEQGLEETGLIENWSKYESATIDYSLVHESIVSDIEKLFCYGY